MEEICCLKIESEILRYGTAGVRPFAAPHKTKYIAYDIVIAHAIYLCLTGAMTAPDRRLIWLLSRAQRRVVAQADDALSKLGLTSTQAGALFCVRSADGITIGELADQLDLAQSAASGLAQRLETAGLVERSPDPSDGRSVRLVLTKLGKKRREEALKIAHAGNAALGEGFSSAEIAIVARWLAHIATATETDK